MTKTKSVLSLGIFAPQDVKQTSRLQAGTKFKVSQAATDVTENHTAQLKTVKVKT